MNRSQIDKRRRHLIVWEPKIVDSVRFDHRTLKEYGHVYCPSVDWAAELNGNVFNWPQDELSQYEDLRLWALRRNKAVVVQANKFSSSKGEMYSLRREVCADLSSEIDLYGVGWNSGLIADFTKWIHSLVRSKFRNVDFTSLKNIGNYYSNYFGPTNDKIQQMSKYRFAVVIENSTDYVSEKLFDAVSAGCIVLYIGPKLERFGIPTDAAYECAPSFWAIQNKMRELQKLDLTRLNSIRKRQREAMEEIVFSWKNEIVLANLARLILKNMS